MLTPTPTAAPELVRIPLGKGCLLVLTWAESRRAIARGKAERRRAAMAVRLGERGRDG